MSSLDALLERGVWLLETPCSRIDTVGFALKGCECSFQDLSKFDFCKNVTSKTEKEPHKFRVIRDDLLHPTLGGNKIRKLDAVVPFLKDEEITDVVRTSLFFVLSFLSLKRFQCLSGDLWRLSKCSCCCCSSAVACAEHGMSAHLLLRGEKIEVTTGYNLISEVYGNVVYVPRTEYADRQKMLSSHMERVACPEEPVLWLNGNSITRETITPSESSKLLEPGRGRRKWAVLGEGGASGLALLGFIRLVRWLSENEVFERDDKIKIVVDSGTGTSAIGLALGIALLGLHQWEIVGVMLSGSREYYERQTKNLVTGFLQQFRCDQSAEALSLNLVWEERKRVRRFGKIYGGEIGACKSIARQTGILLDPIYTLAAWEVAIELSWNETADKVAILHTGGALGLFGLAQTNPQEFSQTREYAPPKQLSLARHTKSGRS
ncbi:D-cysteine desulfhydrase 2, mitochondrial isoform X1 [Selaginella moellendorffii]|uniref:D-cysteine desulfhydrase 2, mitochondrial isoform X1 n=1 Tax=Selaginella moellendorffii TaxID=88036 RepID=UPI000D1CEECA|nr:D-cysteine desulfhydrase 2, mitochondrial isoform X1 [Selaginella moellendorffii]|eukprot:XP_024539891.1 D-cysteine desulfhydrase 2, mitochondrial isoform X1 [Selaginella moellendorffii]